MYRIILADDEPWAIIGLQKIIKWEDYGFEIILTVSDGLSALNAIRQHKPDLFISDISMPGLDGLSLIKQLKEDFPDMPVILITGHSDFSFAQEAIRQNVFDYLVKQVKKSELIEALTRVKRFLQERDNAPNWELYFSLFDDDSVLTVDECLAEMNIPNTFLSCYVISVMYNNKVDSDLICVENNINNSNIYFRSGTHEQMILVMQKDAHISTLPMLDSINTADARYIGVSTTSKLTESLNQMIKQSDIAMMTALMRNAHVPIQYHFDYPDVSKQLLNEFSSALRNNDQEMLISALDKVEKACEILLLDTITDICNQMVSKLTEHEYGEYEALELHYCQELTSADSFDTLISPLRRCIQNNKTVINVPPTLISRVMESIEEHFTQNIRITELAKQFFITPNYLSILIKRETGYSFTELIIMKRLALARKLLKESDFSIQDIVEKVGYKEYSCFIKTFKKHVGITPYQYRKQARYKMDDSQ